MNATAAPRRRIFMNSRCGESLFHGVQALRLNPIGGGFSFDRVGLLAHPYMLGPNGDSNGCVSFKDYDAFLRAFQSGEVKRLAVVAQWTRRASPGRTFRKPAGSRPLIRSPWPPPCAAGWR